MGFPTRAVSIVVDKSRPDDVYAALEVSGVIRSTDCGESWTDLSQSLIELSGRPHLKRRIGSDRDSEGMLDSHAIVSSAARSRPHRYSPCAWGFFRAGMAGARGATWKSDGTRRLRTAAT